MVKTLEERLLALESQVEGTSFPGTVLHRIYNSDTKKLMWCLVLGDMKGAKFTFYGETIEEAISKAE